jgi:hypothetical protein
MELVRILRELLGHRRALVVGVLVALAAAILSVYHLDGFSLKSRGLRYSSAATTVFIDTPASVLGNVTQNFEPLQARATAYANFMASPTVLNLIGHRVGIPGDQIYAAGPVDPSVPRIVEEPTAVERNVEITGETDPYRLNFNNDPNLPTVGIYAQAPSTQLSIALANAAAVALNEYVSNLENENHTSAGDRVVVRQLGSATGGVVDAGIDKSLAGMAFIGVFLAWCVLILLATRFRGYWRASEPLARPHPRDSGPQPPPDSQPQTEPEGGRTNGRAPAHSSETAVVAVSNQAGQTGAS